MTEGSGPLTLHLPESRLLLLASVSLALAGTGGAAQAPPPEAAAVARMARIGRAFSPSFSPDGKRIAFISDLSGTPQIWVVAAGGGWPTLVTNDTDPVGSVVWSPAADWLAYTLAPGGGMNTQVYVVRPDGTGSRRLTPGGKETNRLFMWTHDGRRLATGSNTRSAAAIDALFTDPATGATETVVQNDGIASVDDLSRDGTRAIVNRLISRGDNNLYLVDTATRRETLLTPHSGARHEQH
jgi:Tol biopolymer transport system component